MDLLCLVQCPWTVQGSGGAQKKFFPGFFCDSVTSLKWGNVPTVEGHITWEREEEGKKTRMNKDSASFKYCPEIKDYFSSPVVPE